MSMKRRVERLEGQASDPGDPWGVEIRRPVVTPSPDGPEPTGRILTRTDGEPWNVEAEEE